MPTVRRIVCTSGRRWGPASPHPAWRKAWRARSPAHCPCGPASPSAAGAGSVGPPSQHRPPSRHPSDCLLPRSLPPARRGTPSAWPQRRVGRSGIPRGKASCCVLALPNPVQGERLRSPPAPGTIRPFASSQSRLPAQSKARVTGQREARNRKAVMAHSAGPRARLSVDCELMVERGVAVRHCVSRAAQPGRPSVGAWIVRDWGPCV